MPRKKKKENKDPEVVQISAETQEAKKNLARPMWKGAISFGLINIPVRLYAGYRTKTVRFHLLHQKDKSRIEERIFCASEQKPISREEIVKGYEITPGQHVIVGEKELDHLAPKASRTIELIQFVDLKEIDPIYYGRPYYLIPEETSAKAYILFIEALKKSGKVGLAKFVMRKKEYLAALRPLGQVIYLDTMHFSDEIVLPNEIQDFVKSGKASEAEIKMAEELIRSLTASFEPEKLHDHYREALLDLIDKKIQGKEIALSPAAEFEEEPQVVDLMSALKASLAEANKRNKKKAA